MQQPYREPGQTRSKELKKQTPLEILRGAYQKYKDHLGVHFFSRKPHYELDLYSPEFGRILLCAGQTSATLKLGFETFEKGFDYIKREQLNPKLWERIAGKFEIDVEGDDEKVEGVKFDLGDMIDNAIPFNQMPKTANVTINGDPKKRVQLLEKLRSFYNEYGKFYVYSKHGWLENLKVKGNTIKFYFRNKSDRRDSLEFEVSLSTGEMIAGESELLTLQTTGGQSHKIIKDKYYNRTMEHFLDQILETLTVPAKIKEEKDRQDIERAVKGMKTIHRKLADKIRKTLGKTSSD